MWIFSGISCFRPTFRLTLLKMSEIILMGCKTQIKKKKVKNIVDCLKGPPPPIRTVKNRMVCRYVPLWHSCQKHRTFISSEVTKKYNYFRGMMDHHTWAKGMDQCDSKLQLIIKNVGHWPQYFMVRWILSYILKIFWLKIVLSHNGSIKCDTRIDLINFVLYLDDIGHHKNLSWAWGRIEKYVRGSSFAELCQTVILRDGFLYPHQTTMIDSFSCIPFDLQRFILT